MEELLSWNEKIEVSQNVQDEDMVDAIVNPDGETEADTTTDVVEIDLMTHICSAQVKLKGIGRV